MELNELSVAEVRDLARAKGIKLKVDGSYLRKGVLIDLVLEAGASEVETTNGQASVTPEGSLEGLGTDETSFEVTQFKFLKGRSTIRAAAYDGTCKIPVVIEKTDSTPPDAVLAALQSLEKDCAIVAEVSLDAKRTITPFQVGLTWQNGVFYAMIHFMRTLEVYPTPMKMQIGPVYSQFWDEAPERMMIPDGGTGRVLALVGAVQAWLPVLLAQVQQVQRELF